MKDLLKKPVTFEKVEFWVATAAYMVSVYILAYNQYVQIVSGDINTPNVDLFQENGVPYSYSKDYFIPQFLINSSYYFGFLLVNFFIIKSLVNKRHVLLNIILLILVFAATVAIIGASDTWIMSYLYHDHTEDYLFGLVFKQEFVFVFIILLALALYTIVKYILQSIFSNIHFTFLGNKQLTRECLIALGFWMLLAFFFKMSVYSWKIGLVWCEVILYGIVLYWYLSCKTIPDLLAKQLELRDYLLRVIVVLLLTTPVISIISYVIFRRLNAVFYVNVFNGGFGLFVVAPFAWFLYQYKLGKAVEIQGLKTALGRSSANLDFLRSQINPHFLFNALNTLYGTSLQENAERTGEGIQKLGDMMRFMLQENMQEKIALAREIDYLDNYIALQKLRTQTSTDILIQTEIDQQVTGLEIAPMLLIPFVENAFKHGISLREPSHIKISLQTRNNQLFFDVSNSIHPKTANDPEQFKSGIGLENVRQRLQLLYPKSHELVIRESAREFFIHLTLQL